MAMEGQFDEHEQGLALPMLQEATPLALGFPAPNSPDANQAFGAPTGANMNMGPGPIAPAYGPFIPPPQPQHDQFGFHVDPFVRPESSASNYTFATQLMAPPPPPPPAAAAFPQLGPIAPPNAYGNEANAYGHEANAYGHEANAYGNAEYPANEAPTVMFHNVFAHEYEQRQSNASSNGKGKEPAKDHHDACKTGAPASVYGEDSVINGYNLRNGERELHPRPLPSVKETGGKSNGRNGNGSQRNSSSMANSAGVHKPKNRASSAHVVAGMVMSGATEYKGDKTLSRYLHPEKMPAPILGSARFKDSKMFSVAEPEVTSNLFGNAQPTLLPPFQEASVRPLEIKVPDWLALAMQGLMTPTYQEATHSLPIVPVCCGARPPTAGVIKIKDIPYSTTKAEMTAFVGRNAQITRQPEGSQYHAVHIMMERETGKTNDCYIEVATPLEAETVIRQFQRRIEANRAPKVGDRVVEVVLSSQAELMAELFPRAKHVLWRKGVPVIDHSARYYYPGTLAAGFDGFINNEELVMLTKHASMSENSPFASKSPCRVYESAISTLHKYPWYCPSLITIGARRAVFDCMVHLLRHLIDQVRRVAHSKFDPLQPTEALLQEFVVAILTCTGFGERQKSYVVHLLRQQGLHDIATGQHVTFTLGGNHEFARKWPFTAVVLGPRADQNLMRYYAFLFRRATNASQRRTVLEYLNGMPVSKSYFEHPVGDFHTPYGKDRDNLTLDDAAQIETDDIFAALGRTCYRPNPSPDAALFDEFVNQDSIGDNFDGELSFPPYTH